LSHVTLGGDFTSVPTGTTAAAAATGVAAPAPSVPDVPSVGVPPVDNTISAIEARAKRVAQGGVDLPLTCGNELENCIANLTG